MFIPFYLDYRMFSNKVQAMIVLHHAREFHNAAPSDTKVGLTYSANEDQTNEIARVYSAENGWDTRTTGVNQAEVIMEIEALLRTDAYADCRTFFRILPITTILTTTQKDALSHRKVVDKDLGELQNFSRDGNIVFAWVNGGGFTNENRPSLGAGVYVDPAIVTRYAVGGGEADHALGGENFPYEYVQYVFNGCAIGRWGFFPVLRSSTVPVIISQLELPDSIILEHMKVAYRRNGGGDTNFIKIFPEGVAKENAERKMRELRDGHTGLLGLGIFRMGGASAATLEEMAEFKQQLEATLQPTIAAPVTARSSVRRM